MKLLCICDPPAYSSPKLDIPNFYQHLALDSRVDFFHLPTPYVLQQGLNPQRLNVAAIEGELSYQAFLQLQQKAQLSYPLEHFDLVFCRTLKPFPPGYLELLSSWEKKVHFVNRPSSKIEQIRPHFLLKAASEFTPEILVTDQAEEIESFCHRHQIIVAKQANSCGGRGVFKIWYQAKLWHVDNLLVGTRKFTNSQLVISYLLAKQSEPLLLMPYLKGVGAGDKRVIVVNGEIYGAYIRRSRSGYWVNNVSGDGDCFLAEISEGEREAIEKTVGYYRDRDLLTLGYDFLLDETGDWRISEINAGNIGGFARLEMLTGKPIIRRFTSWLIEFALSG